MNASREDDMALMAATFLLDTDPAAAAQGAGALTARRPDHLEAHLLLSVAYRRLGNGLAAVACLEPLAVVRPDSAVLQLELGRAYIAAGMLAQAMAALQRAVSLSPSLADAWQTLAEQYFLSADIAAGDAAYFQYLKLSGDSPALLEARIAYEAGRLGAAAARVEERLGSSPRDVEALHLQARIAIRSGDPVVAEAALRGALDMAPGHAPARFDLARLLYDQERVAELSTEIARLIAVAPDDVDYLCLRAQTLRLQGRIDEALAAMRAVLERHPHDARCWLILGNLARALGDRSEAIGAFQQAIKLAPNLGEAHWSLANLKTFRFSASDRSALQAALGHPEARMVDRVHLEFALGKAFEDEGDYAAAYAHYASGNSLQRQRVRYESANTTAFVARCRRLFTPAFFAARAGFGIGSVAPIFVVGLPRSGSTLLEQILATHSQIEGTRELPTLPAIARSLTLQAGAEAVEYPNPVADLTADQVGRLAESYLADTAPERPLGRSHFVDKMLGNFSHLAVIHLMFPRATVIDVRRHPLACGFSCFKQLFAKGMFFSYDLEELGRYYRDYDTLMAHYDAVLPGRIYRCYYERLVSDAPGEVQRLLAHCGLPFEAACLRFHENPRVVQTVSSEQVRQPIYPDGVDRWRGFERWLDPLRRALDGLDASYLVDAQKKGGPKSPPFEKS